MNRILIVYYGLFFCLSCSRNDIHIEYYESGNVSFEVPLKNGLYEGVSHEYYENNLLKSIAEWHEGKMNGKKVDFYPDSKIKKSAYFKEGVFFGKSTDYYPTGGVKEEIFYDEKGKMIEYFKYNKKGKLDPDYRAPIFITEKHIDTLNGISDTIFFDNLYVAKIRLGNRMHHKINLHIIEESTGSSSPCLEMVNETMLYKNSKNLIPNIDSLTCLYQFKPFSKGNVYIYGVIYDIYEKEDSLSFLTVKFRHKLYVR